MSHQGYNKKTNEYCFRMYNKKTKIELKDKTNQIIDDLSLFGRSISDTGHNKSISRRFGPAVKKGIILFSWNPYNRKSVVVLDPQYEMIKLNNHYVKIKRR